MFFVHNILPKTLFRNRIYLASATVIRIPDVNFTIEKKKHFIYFDTSHCTRSIKFDTYFDTPQVLIYIRRVSKYVSKYLIHIAYVSKYVRFFDTYCNMYQLFLIHILIHGWIDPIKTMVKTIHRMIHGAKF